MVNTSPISFFAILINTLCPEMTLDTDFKKLQDRANHFFLLILGSDYSRFKDCIFTIS